MMRKYKVVLDEFISAREIEDNFRKWADKKEEIIIFDFHRLKTIDQISFKALFRVKKGLELIGKSVYFCCLPPCIASVISFWDIELEGLFEDEI
ncbi:MAG: STAS domain-containing protein [Nautiliaceae bacterium]